MGCGSGYPYDFYFSNKGYDLVGIDFRFKNIELAKTNNKKAQYICADIEDYEINEKINCTLPFRLWECFLLLSTLKVAVQVALPFLTNIY